MDQLKKISKDEFINIQSKFRFSRITLTKDYYATLLLYLLKDIREIYFKGGTAMQKIFLNYSRLSEDLDYTAAKNIEDIKNKIITIIESSDYFKKATIDKDVEGFTRIVAHYEGFSDEKGVVFVDLNQRAKLMQKPEKHNIPHFYGGFIPKFSVTTLAKNEMIAEKVAAAIGRNKPRDHFDVYMLIKNGFKTDLKLVKEKCRQSGVEFDIVKMFNNAKKLHKRWNEDMLPLISEDVEFKEVMQTMAKFFRLR